LFEVAKFIIFVIHSKRIKIMDSDLLALFGDMLRKQDQHSEMFRQTNEILLKQSETQERQMQALGEVIQELKSLKTDTQNLNLKFDKLFNFLTDNVLERLQKLEDEVFKK
jgi:UDP-2,3-diacylglucosamine pyrophosphatase LpxH